MSFLNQYWSRLRWLLWAVAVLVHCSFLLVYGVSMEHDEGFQIGALHGLHEGQGIGTYFVSDASDLSAIEYQALTWWPPGKTFAVSVFYAITGDLWWAAFWLDAVSVALLLAAWGIILEVLADVFSVRLRLGIWLYLIGLYTIPVGSTNLNALMLFWWAVLLCLWGVRTQRRLWWLGMVAGVLCGLKGWLRYGYYPAVAIIPLAIGFYALWYHVFALLKMALAATLSGGAIILALFLYNQSVSDASLPTYFADGSGRIYYWHHLLQFVPFPSAALGTNAVFTYVFDRFGIPQQTITLVLWLASALVLVVFARLLWQVLFRSVSIRASLAPKNNVATYPPVLAFFLITGMGALLLIVGMLSVTSVLSSPQGTWTFVAEMRYYAPIWGFLAGALLVFLFYRPIVSTSVLERGLRWAAWGLLITTVIAAIFTRAATLNHVRQLLPVTTGEARIEAPIYHIVQAAQQHHLPVVYLGGTLFDGIKQMGDVTLTGAAIYELPIKDADVFATRNEIVVIVAIPSPESGQPEQIAALEKFVANHAGRYLEEIPGFVTYYEVLLKPAS